MGMPAFVTQNQTGTSGIWFADWMQTPFSISMGTEVTGAPVYNIEYTLDNIDVANGLGTPNATTAANATWFQSAITAQTIATTGTISAPIRALRVNVTSSNSTAIVVAIFTQATFGR